MTHSSIAGLGEVMQIAFVPENFEAALVFWTKTMGAGPFFLIENARAEAASHRGQPTDPALTIALGHWGDMQIELIRQENDAASPYREWSEAGGKGVHHVCVVVEEIEAAKRACAETGADILFTGRMAGTEWFYVDTGGGPGTILEVVRYSEMSKDLMATIRDAARGWDGRDPVRRLG